MMMMMRYAILLALMLCLPVRGEAWQVVGGVDNYFLLETFTTATDTNLSSHLPDKGGAWVFDTNIGGSDTTVFAANNYAMQTADTPSFAYNTVVPPSADYSVTTKVSYHSSSAAYTQTAGPCLRMTASGGGYCARYEPSGKKLMVFRKASDDSSWASTARVPVTLSEISINAAPDYCTLTISAMGATIVATLKDSSGALLGTAPAPDTTYSEAGYPGLFFAPTQLAKIVGIYAE